MEKFLEIVQRVAHDVCEICYWVSCVGGVVMVLLACFMIANFFPAVERQPICRFILASGIFWRCSVIVIVGTMSIILLLFIAAVLESKANDWWWNVHLRNNNKRLGLE